MYIQVNVLFSCSNIGCVLFVQYGEVVGSFCLSHQLLTGLEGGFKTGTGEVSEDLGRSSLDEFLNQVELSRLLRIGLGSEIVQNGGVELLVLLRSGVPVAEAVLAGLAGLEEDAAVMGAQR